MAFLVLCAATAICLVAPTLAQSPRARAVIVNKTRVRDAQISSLEQRYRVRIQDGSYWYDAATGSWGQQDGPTAGLIAPGLNFGSLRADASNGTTGVFINGRQLHARDVAGLSTIMRVLQGRYWMDASGNFGYEREPMIGNIHALANSVRAPRQGILSTYDKTGAVVIGQ
ncbi:MAG: hypothetical protein ABJC07_00055 [Acidobacteriota bacterium]